jgi:xanthine dehydrogenase accessory factor
VRPLAVVRGAGDLATGVGRRLQVCGFSVVHLEIPAPTVIRRRVAFASAVYQERITVEGVEAALARDVEAARAHLIDGMVAVLVDPAADSIASLRPLLVVDAILAKRNLGTHRRMAPRVVALGPGFVAGLDVHAVVETCRGHDLGRVITEGAARPDTGIPGDVGGLRDERLLRAPRGGTFRPVREIGDIVRAGDVVAEVEGAPVPARTGGVLRGLLYPGLTAREGQKVGDVDPRGEPSLCFTISDKANAVAGGVLEAALRAGLVRSLAMTSVPE